jgi:hypothetical protein
VHGGRVAEPIEHVSHALGGPAAAAIAGLAAGQVARHGLLAQVRDLDLELLEERRTGRTGSM